MKVYSFLGLFLLSSAVSAHPGGHGNEKSLEARKELISRVSNLDHCHGRMAASGIQTKAVERRSKLASKLSKRDLSSFTRRGTDPVFVDHEADLSLTATTTLEEIFASNHCVVLFPEEEEGSYHHHSDMDGEYIRSNIAEDQVGIPVTLDLQFIDVETCEPVQGVAIEIWSCNSTGVYSGVVIEGNGDADPANINSTFMRGAQFTDKIGAVQFETIFPGHYYPRATHVHVFVHLDVEKFPNGTIRGDTAAHVGQLYFDQTLIAAVEATYPYTTNTQQFTYNKDDWLLGMDAVRGWQADPFLEYVRLGDSIEDGLLAWISMGVNMSFTRDVWAAATLYPTAGYRHPAKIMMMACQAS
ncbi:conserved hypothetical protein [Talaromyces stipitatus ATCC 10500]|uniref:Intradiol ring-cleavage dioxygenases domain-containing protein n=1 Tax=Talaromyces stipitatus (strain ATCC 10500 / CBS 375.48 / QM 6759 / NRRL 1006) TaxID=441959 RepID=B8LZ42_TALSN|nr:uncharacterized protein TSTA_083190 [Talaromyces stipitatus ATCC 10500]EED21086.1 conserved hypothetical protein [Talaromyces stipitatus ATCC 10500]